ncbi:MAG TPA: PhzF family phenazine biosynthesis protein [Gemmatimonadales bacterium]|nr:PhzF family phenazine biosynthesis protein [Gemmatimonadales bacterium]
MPNQPIAQVDAFTDRPFAGNPAGVCVLPAPRDAEWMQRVAAEMNVAETAFLVRRADGDGWDLRWFTPTVEVDLCGHATLASAHLLWEAGHVPPGAEARFHTRSGLLTARRGGPAIELDFPSEPAEASPLPEGLADALGAAPVWGGRNRMDWLVEVESAAVVRALAPDLGRIAQVPARGVIVTSRADDGSCDFVSRFFAPQAGVPEDPVTGSAHCCLAPFWAPRLGRDTLVGRQLSARGGTVHVRLAGDRVVLGGAAVTVLRGELVA